MAIVPLFFVLLSLIPLIHCSGCPPKEMIAPCTCIYNDLYCEKNSLTSSELVDIFKRISRDYTDLHFSSLSIWRNFGLKELRANTFQDVTFDSVEISVCPNLVDVHEDAFSGVQNIATRVVFSSTGKSILLMKGAMGCNIMVI